MYDRILLSVGECYIGNEKGGGYLCISCHTFYSRIGKFGLNLCSSKKLPSNFSWMLAIRDRLM